MALEKLLHPFTTENSLLNKYMDLGCFIVYMMSCYSPCHTEFYILLKCFSY